jgi:hypothetical protein
MVLLLGGLLLLVLYLFLKSLEKLRLTMGVLAVRLVMNEAVSCRRGHNE